MEVPFGARTVSGHHVNERVAGALVIVPAEGHEDESATGAVEDCLAPQVAVGVGDLGVAIQHCLNDFGIAAVEFQCPMSPCC